MPVVPTRRLLIEVPSSGLESSSLPPGIETLAADPSDAWLVTPPLGRPLHPWDEAHRAVASPADLGLESGGATYAEPELVQGVPYRDTEGGLESGSRPGPCEYTGPDDFWPGAALGFGWHLGDEFSGLRAARDAVGQNGRRVRLVILDTGYDPTHASLPLRLLTALQRNFAGGDPDDATDLSHRSPLNNPGHGTATLALLAGGRVSLPDRGFDDFLGGAPHAEVVPVRIADSVIHFGSRAMASGIRYATEVGAEVVSISMGGLPARAWAQAVNRAYEAGVTIFAAAGNRIGPSPPSTIVWPARFKRVVAVCGATADKTPYHRDGWHRKMQGCFGPAGKMPTAMAAYTPNTPWASIGCRTMITGDGAGTSSATPQAAAAAALWLQAATVPAGIEPWQRVEAVRHALFQSADSGRPQGQAWFGRGLLRARQALDVPFQTNLPMTPPDSVSFAWLRLAGGLEAAPSGRELMYEVEALQVYEQSPRIQEITGGACPETDLLDRPTQKRLVKALRESPLVSDSLRAHLADLERQL